MKILYILKTTLRGIEPRSLERQSRILTVVLQSLNKNYNKKSLCVYCGPDVDSNRGLLGYEPNTLTAALYSLNTLLNNNFTSYMLRWSNG